jgi:RNase H-fold protein (predicted Holliday junction resolvase)
VIMFAASVGMAYPVTRDVDYQTDAQKSNFFGRPLQAGFDCHVVCVNESIGCQAVNRQECQYVEVVIDQVSQMLPLAVLWFEDIHA